MNNRERVQAILHYRDYDRMPVVSFGLWRETPLEWAKQGCISRERAEEFYRDGNGSPASVSLLKELGFDFDWGTCVSCDAGLFPAFEKDHFWRLFPLFQTDFHGLRRFCV